MIRLTWVQARTQTVVTAAALVVVAGGLAISGPHLVQLYHSVVGSCQANGDCATATAAYLGNDNALRTWLDILVSVVPGVVGIFWGAPLVAREREAGTYRLAWTQSVTRSRWLAVKLAVVGGFAMAVAGLLSLMVTWWASPLDRAHMTRFVTFDERDLVPVGYAAFAFVLGVAAGLIIRRTVPAMATTLVAFVAIRLAVGHWLRPRLFAPLHQSFALSPTLSSTGIDGVGPGALGTNTLQLGPPNLPNAWITSTQLVDRGGHTLTAQFMNAACPGIGGGGGAGGGGGGIPGGLGFGSSGSHSEVPQAAQDRLTSCIQKVAAHYHEVVAYQPPSRYWPLQWVELAIFVVAALALAGLCLWWIRRRFS